MAMFRAIAAATVCILFSLSTALAAPIGTVGIMQEGKVYVSAQSVFEELGCQVVWDKQMQILLLKTMQNRLTINLKTNEAVINGKSSPMPYAPRFVKNEIYVPLRFCAEALAMSVDWNDQVSQAVISRAMNSGRSARVIIAVAAAPLVSKPTPATFTPDLVSSVTQRYRSFSQQIDEHTVNIVEIAPGGLKAELGLAQGRVGATEELSSIASRDGAVVAINGSYFAAYGGTPDPWNLLIRGGKVLHVGSNGTAIGFTAAGNVKMATAKVKIEGSTKGSYQWPNNWYAYGFNHTAEGNSVYIYTPERGIHVGFTGGTAAIITNGRITHITSNDNVIIPRNGFVVIFSGSERSLLERFSIGSTASYRVAFEETEDEVWSDVITSVGAGPRLVVKGRISVDPIGEGFTEAKITQDGSARSAIGVKRDGTILLVTTGGATIHQLAQIMHTLGSWQAMNLDGGASSGLWVEGHYVTEPSRQVSNALIFR